MSLPHPLPLLSPLGIVREHHVAYYLPWEGYELILTLHRPGYVFPLGGLEIPPPNSILIHDLWGYVVKGVLPPPPYFPFPNPDFLSCINVLFMRPPVKEQFGKGKKKAVMRLELIVTGMSDLGEFVKHESWCYYGKEIKRYSNKETPFSQVTK